jgi:tetratricopeptide (TPR) repeat protein
VLSNTAKTLLHSDPDRALTYLRVAYGLAPGHPETLINIGVAFTTKEDRMSSIRYYAKALRDDPEHPSVRNPIRCSLMGLASHLHSVHSLQDSSAEE